MTPAISCRGRPLSSSRFRRRPRRTASPESGRTSTPPSCCAWSRPSRPAVSTRRSSAGWQRACSVAGRFVSRAVCG
ncbi:hypothetical protein C4K88_09710 [Arthrobacter pityocampae]|uniref:Uncharacterized protein n=1 Tax=Arthrobacter pityocampae TaxID=547334 RepID=A0A2S5IWT0_9MICC|nr:hypothetical protein C4K88_09710 [Arthrobacter pityocampae]